MKPISKEILKKAKDIRELCESPYSNSKKTLDNIHRLSDEIVNILEP